MTRWLKAFAITVGATLAWAFGPAVIILVVRGLL